MEEDKFSKDDAYRNLERVNYFISSADTKTSFVLAFVGVIMLAFFTSGMIDEGFTSFLAIVSKLKLSDLKGAFVVLTAISIPGFIFFLVKGTFRLIAALTAKIDPHEFKNQNLVLSSNLFLGSIAAKRFDEFSSELDALSSDELAKDINSQTFINAKICNLKFQNYNLGLKNIRLTIVFFVASFILFMLARTLSA